MKKPIVIVLGIALFGLPVVAIAAQNFSGSWVRNDAKSDRVPNQQYWLTRDPNSGGAGGGGGRGGGGGGRGATNQVVITVQQDSGSLTVTSPQGVVQKYTLDGKPFSKTTDTGIAKAIVSASTQGETVVITTTQPWGGMPGNATLDIKEVWSLSADGKVLTVTTTRNTPALQNSFKTVYNKK